MEEVTVCIPMSRAAKTIENLLNDFLEQRFVGFIIISVESRYNVNHLSKLAADCNNKGLKVKWIKSENGRATALRNAAVAVVSTRWCLFLDDDVRLTSHFCATLRCILVSQPSNLVIQGRPFQGLDEASILSYCESKLFELRIKRSLNQGNLSICDARNLLMPTDIIRRIEFDGNLQNSGGYDLARKLEQHKILIEYRDQLVVLHKNRRTIYSIARQKFHQGRSRYLIDKRYRSDKAAGTAYIKYVVKQHALGSFRYGLTEKLEARVFIYAFITSIVFTAGLLREWAFGR